MFKLNIEPPKTTNQASNRIITPKPPRKPFVGKYTSGKWRKAEQRLTFLIKPHAPKEPLEGPLFLVVKWVYPYRKADKKYQKAGVRISCDTQPDTDNIIKGLKDIMEKLGFYNNDAQIARDDFHKMWGPEPGIFVSLTKIK